MAVTHLGSCANIQAILVGGGVTNERELHITSTTPTKQLLKSQNQTLRAQTTGAKPRDTSSFTMQREYQHRSEKKETKHARKNVISALEDWHQAGRTSQLKEIPSASAKPAIQERDTSGLRGTSRGRVPHISLPTPLRGNVDSPLKPYKFHEVRRGQSVQSRLVTPSTAQTSRHASKRRDHQDEKQNQALKLLINTLSDGMQSLEFRDMLQVKVSVGISQHIPHDTLDVLTTAGEIFEELLIRWKINRFDLDLLEYLLRKVGEFEKYKQEIESYKVAVDYTDLVVSTEREVTTIISSLHSILQGSEETENVYTTVCFLHYGSVHSFSRERLSCFKQDLSNLLTIHPTQITYIAKVAGSRTDFLTLCQMPCSVCKKLVICARKNDEVLMALGLKGIQITGSDGLRYTQSLGYLQEKISVGTQTSTPYDERPSRSSVSFYEGNKSRILESSWSQAKQPWLMDQGYYQSIAAEGQMQSPSFSQNDPDEAKFERRLQLVKSSINEASHPKSDDFTSALLEQIRNLHRTVASLKKDLRDKSRQVNASQGYIKQAQKEMKVMELKLETKARQISQTNVQLVKKCKSLIAENIRLANAVQRMETEIDVQRQIGKENKFDNILQAAGF